MKEKLFRSIESGGILESFTTIRLSPDVRLRREYFGGLVYDTRNGNILEVDNSTFQFLHLIKDRVLKVSDAIDFKSIDRTLQRLVDLKIIEEKNEFLSPPILIDTEILTNNQNEAKINHKSWLSAPETVHWAVTYRCHENCPDCYVQRFSDTKNELDTHQGLKLIDKIADWGVFQLALGGGEPFNRKDLPQLVSHAATRGLSVHITTGKLEIDRQILESICPFVKVLQLGIRPDDMVSSDSTKEIQQIHALLTTVKKLGITIGANLFLTKSTIEELENLIKILLSLEFNHIVLLRYKPPESIERWKAENPTVDQMKGLHEKISKILKENPQPNIRVDCALSFLQRHLPQGLATRLGIKGCVAADRIVALSPDGSVYPCSQLVHPKCYAGNLLESEPELIWRYSQILRKYRSFRTKKTFTHSWCGVCQAKYICGGCRVFASDGLGGDPGCPEPILPPITQLGKIGRSLDLVEYLMSHYTISVGEYMSRYGVSQQKAIKELNISPYTVSTTGKSARKKRDTYCNIERDIVSDIQKDIGFTHAGFPFASYEQVSEWIGNPSYLENYPGWIKQQSQVNKL